ncbi:MAG: TolC family protein [Firmicutes bacterium]|nr:TolC family protein [Bacillota bacterium]
MQWWKQVRVGRGMWLASHPERTVSTSTVALVRMHSPTVALAAAMLAMACLLAWGSGPVLATEGNASTPTGVMSAAAQPTAAGGAGQPAGQNSGGKVPAAAAPAKNSVLHLADALQLAFAQGPDLRSAQLTLQGAKLAYEQAQADQLAQPSVLTALSAESAWKQAQLDYASSSANIALQVEQAYYDAIKADRTVALARNNLDSARQQADAVHLRYKLGAAANLDVLAADSAVGSAQADLDSALANQTLAYMKLNALLGRDLGAAVNLADDLNFTPAKIDLDKALAYALAHRGDVQKAQSNVDQAQKQVEVDDNAYTPSLTLARAKNQLALAQAALDAAKTAAVLEVRQNYAALQSAAAQVPLKQQALEQAKESLKVAQARYSAGANTALDLLNAQKAVYQAETDYLQAVFNYNVSLARFYNSLNLPFEERKSFTEGS